MAKLVIKGRLMLRRLTSKSWPGKSGYHLFLDGDESALAEAAWLLPHPNSKRWDAGGDYHTQNEYGRCRITIELLEDVKDDGRTSDD